MRYQTFIGKSERRADTVCPQMVRALAATLNVPAPAGEDLPPLWHWMLFQEWASAGALGADGHPRSGGFLPLDPTLRRRLWAGGRLQFFHPLHIGEQVTRNSTITGIQEKNGSTGRLLFVNVRHTIGNSAGVALIEEQDLVYLGALGAGSAPSPAVAPVAGGLSVDVPVDTILLFRYSAVTGNSHRIHYDQDYVNEEGYASLVVHGPLQATLLAGFALRQRSSRTLAEFSFRGRRLALLRRCPLTLEAWPEGHQLHLRIIDRDRVICTTAEARFES